jgi:Domain of unknown function (DUF4304)
MTAQDRYRAMLRDEIAPALRARGFQGSGTAYVLPDDTHWLQVGFQASKWNTATGASFTVNLAVADKAAWARLAAERGYRGKPNPNVRYSRDMPVQRLGSLVFGTDRWWEVSEPSTNVATEVLEALDRAGLPWLRAKGATP